LLTAALLAVGACGTGEQGGRETTEGAQPAEAAPTDTMMPMDTTMHDTMPMDTARGGM
jgi:hypothetical protein